LALGRPRFASRPFRNHFGPASKTIYINMRQGFGDAIQCCRYIPLLAQRGANVILGVDERLETLMRCLPARVITVKDPFPEFDMHCPIEALPMAFKTGKEMILADVPYLLAPKDAAWQRILEGMPRPLVGLCWSVCAGRAGRVTATTAIDRYRWRC
jgi:hypothetical protein